MYYSKVTPLGSVQWGPVAIQNGDVVFDGRIVSDRSGGAVVTFVWAVQPNPSSYAGARRISADGVELWSTGTPPNASAPSAVDDMVGGFTITYTSSWLLPTKDVCARHINASSISDWPAGDVPVSSASGDQTHSVAVSNGLNWVIVAWWDTRLSGDQNIYAQNVPGITVPRNDITVRDECGGQQTLTFGQYPTATDDIDITLGEASILLPPSAGVFDARFVFPSLVSSLRDFRNDTLKTISWRMTFQPGSCGYPLTFSWDTVSLTGGSYFLRDEVTGTTVDVDMKLQSSYTLTSSDITSLQIVFSRDEGPLPIQLASFTATLENQSRVRLNWTTLTEVNNFGFDIQKSSDSTSYQTIPNSFIPGHGTTNEPQHYAYIDSTATPGVWYYRLKQIDLDGTVHYSVGVSVNVLAGVKENEMAVVFSLSQNYPNPWNPSTTIRYGLPHNSFVMLTVYNTLGQQVAQLVNEQQQAGYHDVVFLGDGLASGVYFYQLQAGNLLLTRKLLLLR